MISAKLDSWLAAWAYLNRSSTAAQTGFDFIDTPAGRIRFMDTATPGPVVIIVPDGPNVAEHYGELVSRLSEACRVICFDMPGFGFSLPGGRYAHSLDEGARAILSVMDQLNIASATLAFSCANGFYAIRAAATAPNRVDCLVLSQTPSLEAMHAWAGHVVPRMFRVPVLGQLLGWWVRKKAATAWYATCLPRGTDRRPFQQTSHNALQCGGCFSLASVVQGLWRHTSSDLAEVTAPCTLVWGQQDYSHQHTDPHSLLELLPKAQVVIFDDCGHFPDLEQSARFASVLLAEVKKHALPATIF